MCAPPTLRSMIIHNLHLGWAFFRPSEAQTIAIVYANAVLTPPVTDECLEPIPPWRSQVHCRFGRVELIHLSGRKIPQLAWAGRPSGLCVVAVVDVLRPAISEGLYHATMIARLPCFGKYHQRTPPSGGRRCRSGLTDQIATGRSAWKGRPSHRHGENGRNPASCTLATMLWESWFLISGPPNIAKAEYVACLAVQSPRAHRAPSVPGRGVQLDDLVRGVQPRQDVRDLPRAVPPRPPFTSRWCS